MPLPWEQQGEGRGDAPQGRPAEPFGPLEAGGHFSSAIRDFATDPFLWGAVALHVAFPLVPAVGSLRKLGTVDRMLTKLAPRLRDADTMVRSVSPRGADILREIPVAASKFSDRRFAAAGDVGMERVRAIAKDPAANAAVMARLHRVELLNESLRNAGVEGRLRAPRALTAEEGAVEGAYRSIVEGVREDMPDLGRRFKALREAEAWDHADPYGMPRVVKRTRQDSLEAVSRMATTEREAAAQAEAALTKPKTGHVKARKPGSSIPNVDFLREMERNGWATPGLADEAAAALAAKPYLREFRTDFDSIHGYVSGMAREYAFNTTGLGAELKGIARDLASEPGMGGMVGRELEDTIIPTVQGRMTYRRATAVRYRAEMKMQAADGLSGLIDKLDDSHPFKPAAKRVFEYLSESSVLNPAKQLDSSIASAIYLGTLGGNIGAPLKNLGQNIATLAEVGPAAFFRGTARTVEQVGKYFELRAGGAPSAKAKLTAFKDFYESGVRANPLIDEIVLGLEGSMANVGGFASGNRRLGSKIKDALLLPFSLSEHGNRLNAVNSAMIRSAKLPRAQQLAYAYDTVARTQFMGGLQGAPVALANLSPLLRQYLQFPMMFAAYAAGNPGAAGRMYIASRALVAGGQAAFGADLADYTAIGAFPAPSGYGAFPALPIVPPFVGAVGAVGLDIAEGDWGMPETRRSLPIFVPGGVAASRLATVFSPKASAWLGKSYADWTTRGPDGRVGVYTARGNLTGRFTPLQVWMKAMGVRVGDMQAESRKYEQLSKADEAIRGMKRDYVHAMLGGRTDEAMRINEGFKKAFNIPIPVKASEMDAAALRGDVSRVERQARSLPKELQPQALQALRVWASERAGNAMMMGVDPALLEPRVRMREAPRVRTLRPANAVPPRVRQPGQPPQAVAAGGVQTMFPNY